MSLVTCDEQGPEPCSVIYYLLLYVVRERTILGGGSTTMFHGLVCVCVLHIKPFFLPVDIQHNRCPCGFYKKQVMWSQSCATEILRCHVPGMQLLSTAVANAMSCHQLPFPSLPRQRMLRGMPYPANSEWGRSFWRV